METALFDEVRAAARLEERARCLAIVDARVKVWKDAFHAGCHDDCSLPLWEECEDIANAIRRAND